MAENNETKVPEKKESSKLKLILIGVVGLAIVGGAGYWAIGYFKGSKTATATAPGGEDSGTHGEDHGDEKNTPVNVKSTMPLDAFLVNLADKEDGRFVKATFILGLGEEQLGEELAKNPVAVAVTRHAIVSLLSSKSSADILSPEGKDKLREEIRTMVNKVLPKGKVKDVYIVNFVVQL